jgi:glycine/sarcosine N-methyltransferase
MRSKLRADRLLIISVRDYDRMLAERPSTAPPMVVAGPPRRLLVRFNDWEEAGRMYDLHFFVLSEDVSTWTLSAHYQTRYRALPSAELIAAAQEAGFQSINWLAPNEVGFYQPILVAR